MFDAVIRRSGLGLVALLVGLAWFADLALAGIHKVTIDPRGTWLRVDTSSGDIATPATSVDLASLGVKAGGFLRLKGQGALSYGGPDDIVAFLATFANGTTLLAPGSRRRPAQVVTPPTCPNNKSTDVPPDFGFSTSTWLIVQIPPGATSIRFGAMDCYWKDNSDPNGDYAVLIDDMKCGDDRDALIAEYYDRAIYDPTVSVAKDYIPLCSDFRRSSSAASGASTYTVADFNPADGCAYRPNWVLIAPAIRAPANRGHGINPMLPHMRPLPTPYAWPPHLNSGYRSPKRNSYCAGGASRSSHMFGSAVDFGIPGQLSTSTRKSYFNNWNDAAKLFANVRYVEPLGQYCGVSLRCVHADWQWAKCGVAQREIYGNESSSSLGCSAKASTAEVAAALGSIDRLAGVAPDRRPTAADVAAFDAALAPLAAINARDFHPAPGTPAVVVTAEARRSLVRTLSAEVTAWGAGVRFDEDRVENLLRVVGLAGLYGGPEAVRHVLDPSIVATGNWAYAAAAAMGEAAVPTVLAAVADERGPSYPDYVAIACLMRRAGTVTEGRALGRIDRVLLRASGARSEQVRAFAAGCLAAVPGAESRTRLGRLTADRDPMVRAAAREALERPAR